MTPIDFASSMMAKTQRLTPEKLAQLIDSPWIARQCKAVQEGRGDKRRIPGVCWQAWYDDHERKNEKAHSNGLFALDIDHVDVDALWQKIRGREDELDLYVVHRSPGGEGMHIVAGLHEGLTTIAQNQAWLAKEIGTPYDPVCKDWARYYCLAPREYFYYLNLDIFNDDEEED